MTQVIHQASKPKKDNPIKATPINALSAIGSNILPKLVISLYFLAIIPSAISVKAAIMNKTQQLTD